MDIKILIKKSSALEKARDRYDALSSDLQDALKKVVEFDYAVQWLAGDGHCILNVDTTDVAPIDVCLGIIKSDGVLTEEEHKCACI